MAENEENKNGWGVLVTAVLTVVILWGLNWILLICFSNESAERGQFGDMFGSVNALFSGLAFSLLIYTIWLQRQELGLQKEELKLQRKALELQADELKKQAEELAKTAEIQAKALELQVSQIESAQKRLQEEQIRRELQYKPKFTIQMNGRYTAETADLTFMLTNKGEPASKLQVGKCQYISESERIFDYVEKNGQVLLNFRIDNVPDFPAEIEFKITFNDTFGKNYTEIYKLFNDKEKINESNKFRVVAE